VRIIATLQGTTHAPTAVYTVTHKNNNVTVYYRQLCRVSTDLNGGKFWAFTVGDFAIRSETRCCSSYWKWSLGHCLPGKFNV